MMRDPNDSIIILKIYDVDHSNNEPKPTEYSYDKKVFSAWSWVSRFDPVNKKPEDVLPCLTATFRFENDSSNGIERIYSVVCTQPKSFFESRSLSEDDSHAIVQSILVNLTLLEDDEDAQRSDLLARFQSSDYRFVIHESQCFLVVEDGRLVPMFLHEPYWVGEKR